MAGDILVTKVTMNFIGGIVDVLCGLFMAVGSYVEKDLVFFVKTVNLSLFSCLGHSIVNFNTPSYAINFML